MFRVRRHAPSSPFRSASRDAGEREARQAAAQVARGDTATGLRSVPEPGPVPAQAEEALGSPGQPLDGGLRAELEPRFGHDFSKVRVHADGPAADSAGALRARAYTLGQDIVFGRGRYDTASPGGRSLVAHELAHVVQQSRSGRKALQLDSELETVAGVDPRKTQLLTKELSEEGQKELEKVLLRKDDLEPPEGMTFRFGSTISKDLQHGLQNVAIYLTGETAPGKSFLPRSSSIEMAVRTVERIYRFTRLDRSLNGKNGLPLEILFVEESGTAPRPPKPLWEAFPGPFSEAQGPLPAREAREMRDCQGRGASLDACRKVVLGIGAPEPTPLVLDKATVDIGKAKVKRGDGWKETDWKAVEATLAGLPESARKIADGVTFLREAKNVCTEAQAMAKTCDPEWSGKANSIKKAITIFDNAFNKSTTRYGQSTWLETVVVHELGHIADDAPLNAAWAKFKVDKNESKVFKARSRSGQAWIKLILKSKTEYKMTQLRGAAKGSFREAAIQDGLSVQDESKTIVSGGVTAYGQTSWDELFAESFALYYLDPDLLKAIRPKTYAYFLATFPK